MKHYSLILVSLLVLSSCGNKKIPSVKLKNAEDSVSYYIGVHLANQYLLTNGTDSFININAFAMGAKDAMDKKVATDKSQVLMYIQEYFTKKFYKQADDNKKAAEDFLAKNKEAEGVMTDSTGLQYIVERLGTGPKPGPEDLVTVKYEGSLLNGEVFDSNMNDSVPAQFHLNQVIPGWSRGLQLMPAGSRYKLFIPPDMAYGMRPPTEKIAPNSLLIFTVELLDVKKAETPKGK